YGEVRMARLSVTVLSRCTIELDGQVIRLRPTTTAMLIRLVLAAGEFVNVGQLARDIWPNRVGKLHRPDRVTDQRHIGEIRKVLDPERPGASSTVLRTDRGRISAYRLVLDPDQVDLFQFRQFIGRARTVDAVTAVNLLEAALALWQERPLL